MYACACLCVSVHVYVFEGVKWWLLMLSALNTCLARAHSNVWQPLDNFLPIFRSQLSMDLCACVCVSACVFVCSCVCICSCGHKLECVEKIILEVYLAYSNA